MQQTEQIIIGVDPHKLSATIEVVGQTRAAARLGSVQHRPGWLHGDADLREGLA